MFTLIKWSSLQKVSPAKKFNEIDPMWNNHLICNAFDKVLIVHGRKRKSYGGREPKSCLGQFFNFKLGHYVIRAIAWHIQACPTLELKTRPRFCPVSLSLSMSLVTWAVYAKQPCSKTGDKSFCFSLVFGQIGVAHRFVCLL